MTRSVAAYRQMREVPQVANHVQEAAARAVADFAAGAGRGPSTGNSSSRHP